jgi:KDO2-lipid IV(A) lauroyltransferase
MGPLLRLLALLPLPLAHALGVVSGWLFFLLPNEHRDVARRNLEQCFPQLGAAARRRLLRQTLCEVGKTLFETPIIWFSSPQRFNRLVVESVGEEQLAAIGHGALIVGPHLGSWEMVSLYCSAHYPMTSLYRPLRQPRLERPVRSARERFGAQLVPTDAKGIRALFAALKAGGLVGIPPDQDPRDSGGEFAPFFGLQANTMTLLPRLVSKSGARPLLTVAERLPWGRGFRLHFIAMPQEVGSGDAAVAVRAINESVEQAVRRWPAQYQWIYKRFRSRPPGEEPFY